MVYTVRRWNKAALLSVTDDQRRTLEVWVRSRNTSQDTALRARIVLAVAEGVANKRIDQELGTTRTTVILWRERFKQGGVEALTQSEPGRGRPVTYTPKRVKAIVDATTQTKLWAATHWSTRTMAKAQGVSKATSQRIWYAHGLHPHRTTRFKLSTDPRFTEKLTDVVGLYLNPPDKAIVLVKVKAWLARHPRFQLHFTATSSSWLNLVERWFRELT